MGTEEEEERGRVGVASSALEFGSLAGLGLALPWFTFSRPVASSWEHYPIVVARMGAFGCDNGS